ncbi:winged helix-turn-helix transcriptional regulator [Nocardia sp. NPDC051052]|uniref:winged helix-turn-helix transcriptional regulator n=1 Tax=Nocardia sp. NPDC051052 TaxID=3364322 RepID=UPI003799A564
MPAARQRRSECAIAGALDIFGDRWSLLIVRDLFLRGELRYGDFMIGGETIPTNTLATRLRDLETAGVLTRTQYQDNPPRHRYRLTLKGRDLGPVLDAVANWGLGYVPETSRLQA